MLRAILNFFLFEVYGTLALFLCTHKFNIKYKNIINLFFNILYYNILNERINTWANKKPTKILCNNHFLSFLFYVNYIFKYMQFVHTFTFYVCTIKNNYQILK